jgi:hypothetical protein
VSPLCGIYLFFSLFIDTDGVGETLTSDSKGAAGATSTVLDSWEDGASSTPEDGTAKPLVEDGNDIEIDTEIEVDEEKPKPTPKKVVELSTPKPKKEHINIVIIGHVGK